MSEEHLSFETIVRRIVDNEYIVPPRISVKLCEEFLRLKETNEKLINQLSHITNMWTEACAEVERLKNERL